MTVVEQVAPVVTEREGRARVLEGAALEMAVRGRAWNWTCDGGGRVCIGGAIVFAVGHSPAVSQGFSDSHWDIVCNAWGDDKAFQAAANFSDSRRTTDEEVVFAMRWRAEEIRDGR